MLREVCEDLYYCSPEVVLSVPVTRVNDQPRRQDQSEVRMRMLEAAANCRCGTLRQGVEASYAAQHPLMYHQTTIMSLLRHGDGEAACEGLIQPRYRDGELG